MIYVDADIVLRNLSKGNLVLSHFPTFCRILEELRVEEKNSTPRHQSEEMEI